MKKTLSFALGLALAASAFALPTVTDVVFSQSDNGEVTVSYNLANGPAIITADFLTNGVSVGASRFTTLYGDVNVKVEEDGVHSFKWLPYRDLPGIRIDEEACKAAVTAWPEENPPEVLAIDLLYNAEKKVAWYPSVESLPGGLLDNVSYRSHILVLRKCHTKGRTFRIGSPAGTPGRSNNDNDREVSFSYDFWMGVFELTQGQANAIARDNCVSRHNRHHSVLRPVTFRSMGNMRETAATDNAGCDESYAYPHAPSANSILGKIYAHCGLRLELPSEAQWEVACNADCEYGWHGLGSVTNSTRDLTAEQIGRNKYNGGLNPADFTTDFDNETSTTNQGTSVAGQYVPNAWGFYDMLGNVNELTLDSYQNKGASNVYPADGEPYVAADKTGDARAFVVKGSSMYRGNSGSGPASQGSGGRIGNNQHIGARLFYRVDQTSKYTAL